MAQQPAVSSSPDNEATTKTKFELGLEMLRGYRGDLQDRLEKSVGLLIIVMGWLITSETARKSLTSNSSLWWGSVAVLTGLMFMYCLTISNFIGHFRYIQSSMENLGYMDSQYLTRYRMPDKIFYLPVEFSYIAPIFSVYIVIVLILLQIKYRLP
ncbi:MAG TPA: hypothetical protein DC047_02725 [Blastocatellia bacterium]|nr:hypothetical protein [Blastocatellia bacterium]